MHSPHVTHLKKWLPAGLKKFFFLPGSLARKLFYLLLVLGLFLSSLGPSFMVPLLKAVTTTPSFTFTAGGDIGDNANTSATLNLIAQSSSQFHLALGDLSYNEITPESAWCSYVQSHVGSSFPFELLSGKYIEFHLIIGLDICFILYIDYG